MKRKNNQYKKLLKYKRFFPLMVAGVLGIISGIIYISASPRIKANIPAHTSQIVKAAASDISILSVRKAPANELMSGKTITGSTGLIIRIRINNKTDTKQPFIPFNQVFLKSNDGVMYQMTPIRGVSNPVEAGQLQPGSSAEGDISFVVNDPSRDLRLYIDTRWNNSLPTVFTL